MKPNPLRPKKTLSKEEVEYFLSIKPEDINLDLLQDLFADKYDRHKKTRVPSKYNTYDEFTLEANQYFNKEKILTNCGLLIVNKYFFERDLQDVVGYVNKPITKGVLKEISGKLDAYMLEDKIPVETYITYLNRLCWLAFTFNTEICTSLTIDGMKELPEITKAKKEFIKNNKEDLDSGRVATAVKMEKEMVAVAKEIMKNDPSIELYESGARGAFEVAYKNAQIMKGPVYNSSTRKFEIMMNPLAKGITKNDVPTLGNGIVDSAYSKAIAPGECGYLTKKINAGFQSVKLGPKGSDCHTKGYSVVKITKDNIKFYNYSYIIEGDKLVRLDPETQSRFMNKEVKLRTNDYCISKDCCNMCAGDRYYMIGITNIGLTASRMSNSILNGRMKMMHDATVKLYESNCDESFIQVK